MKRWLIFNILFFISLSFLGQDTIIQPPSKPEHGYLVYLAVIDGDTMPYIRLRTVTIIPPRVFKNDRERRRYTRLIRNLKKVLPYAKIAQTKLLVINQHLEEIPEEKARKKYLKQQERIMKKQYGPELTNLTITQGRLLIKLIDRETNNTSYDLIKQFRGSFTAFVWQSVARVFGENLKDEYNASEEDKYIEEILIRIENGQL
ncbi:MAG: DUF4294 domain-containing protein [Bacteroidales bacterium]|nr:DUF4294 domain-containing protein [Bacteroidales bacterium]